MPSDYQSKQTVNQFKLIGKANEFEVRLTSTRDGKPALNLKGQLLVGDRIRVRFSKYIPKFKANGEERKDYIGISNLATEVKTVGTVGKENATTLQIIGSVRANDYVSSQNQMVSTLVNDVGYIIMNPTDPDTAQYSIEGYIKSIAEEGEGLRVRIYALNYAGDIIPFSFYVPSELVNVFNENYSEEQTATFDLDYKALASNNPTNSGGIGIQRSTGKARYDYILVGASPALSPGEPKAIDPEDIREAVARRTARLNEIKETGYRGKSAPAKRKPIGSFASADDFDF